MTTAKPTRITALTPEQQARMAPFAQEWIARGLNTDRADRAAVEDGLRRCYEIGRAHV